MKAILDAKGSDVYGVLVFVEFAFLTKNRIESVNTYKGTIFSLRLQAARVR